MCHSVGYDYILSFSIFLTHKPNEAKRFWSVVLGNYCRLHVIYNKALPSL